MIGLTANHECVYNSQNCGVPMALSVLRASAFVVSVFAFFPAASRHVPAQRMSVHTFSVSGRIFLMDDKPYQIISGEMHYPRIPREYWRDRLQKAKAMGLNTITTYAFWNLHEPRPGVYDSGDRMTLQHSCATHRLKV